MAALALTACGEASSSERGGGAGTGAGSGAKPGSGSTGTTPVTTRTPQSGDATPVTVPGGGGDEQEAALVAGVYFGAPDGDGLVLARVAPPLAGEHALPGGGFDLTHDAIVSVERPGDAAGEAHIVVGAADGKARRSFAVRGVVQARGPALSPDGTMVAFTGKLPAGKDDDVFVAAVDGAGTVDAVRLTTAAVGEDSPRWLGPLRRLVYAVHGDKPGLRVVDVATKKQLASILTGADPGGVAASKDGTHAYACALARGYDVPTGAVASDALQALLAGAKAAGVEATGFDGCDVSPDGSALVLSARVAGGSALVTATVEGAEVKALGAVVDGDEPATPRWLP